MGPVEAETQESPAALFERARDCKRTRTDSTKLATNISAAMAIGT
jgi:hypothetical protein